VPALDTIERWHNRASDTDFVWFPFQRLRPDPATSISMGRRMKMAVCFGLYFGAFYLIRNLIWGDGETFRSGSVAIGISIVCFFAWFSIVTAPLWNRRARRLSIPPERGPL
jgi:hypothetical protein